MLSGTRSISRPMAVSEARRTLAERLRLRLPEIEGATLHRIRSIDDSAKAADPEYAQGLRATLTAALEYGLLAIESGEDRVPSVPVPLLAQARTAARSGVGLDTVLRRYLAGYSLLTDFAIEEAEHDGSPDDTVLRTILRGQAAVLDRLLEAVSEEHRREARERFASREKQNVERVSRLLACEPVDPAPLGYDLEGAHVGLIVCGPSAGDLVRSLADRFGKRVLRVRCDEITVWGWLGSSNHDSCDEVADMLVAAGELGGEEIFTAFGEPGSGPAGWRLTHRQAQAALPVLRSTGVAAGRYRDVALIASVRGDDLFAASLKSIYLAPLGPRHEILRETLKAYFSASRNVSSAAAILGVKRHTVTKRLRTVEERLGLSIADFPVELEAATRLDELEPRASMASMSPANGHSGPAVRQSSGQA